MTTNREKAAETLEYRVEHQHIDNGMWHPLTQWSPEWPLNDGYSVAPDERIVCRRASPPRETPMGKTTQEWQQLLDGTTEGPWEWIDEPDDADAQYIVDCNTGNMCLSVDAIGSGSSYRPSDPLLAAAAPEAVAEVVRLRRALEELRALYIKADYLDGDDWEKGKAHAYRRVLRDLTRILEGGTDD